MHFNVGNGIVGFNCLFGIFGSFPLVGICLWAVHDVKMKLGPVLPVSPSELFPYRSLGSLNCTTFLGSNQCKCMVILKDFTCTNTLFGLVI